MKSYNIPSAYTLVVASIFLSGVASVSAFAEGRPSTTPVLRKSSSTVAQTQSIQAPHAYRYHPPYPQHARLES